MNRLTIRQIQARPGEQPKTLELSGRAGPLDEIESPVEMRGEVEWHNGTGDSTVRLHGSEEGEVPFEFEWESRLLAPGEVMLDNAPIADAESLVALVKDLVRTRAQVLVQWQGEAWVGYLRRFEPRARRLSEYTATLTLQPTAPPVAQGRDVRRYAASPRTLYEQIRDGFETAIAPAERIVTLARTTVDDAAQAVAEVRGGLSRMRAVVDAMGIVQSDITGVKRATGETLADLSTTSGSALASLSQPVSELAQADDPLAQMRARRWRNTNASAHREVRLRAVLARRDYRPEDDILGFHEGVEGQTIWSVAWLWYRDRFYIEAGAEAIRRRNRMTSTSVRGGQRLVIPKRGAA